MAESQIIERTPTSTTIRTGGNGQKLTIPNLLPILPIRNIVVFPGTVMPLNVGVRPATMADLPFIDLLQKKHGTQVGWMPTKQLEGKIAAGQIIIAAERHEGTEARRHKGTKGNAGSFSSPSCLSAYVPSCLS